MSLTFERGDERPVNASGSALGQDGLAIAKPLYSQVRDLLAREISAGAWQPGATLPNEGTLAQRFGVSIGTIRRAVEGLEDIGVVTRRQGRGTFVTGTAARAASERLCRLRTPSGEQLTRMLLAKATRAPTATESRRLAMPERDEVIEIAQLVRCGAKVIGVERHVLPATLATRPGASLPGGREIQSMLAEAGLIVSRVDETISVVPAPPSDCDALGVTPGQLLLQIERRSIALDERVVELGACRYLPTSVCYAAVVD